jgi:hypothetical protein
MVLDMSAGSRTSRAVYTPQEPPNLELVVGGERHEERDRGTDQRQHRPLYPVCPCRNVISSSTPS